MNPSGGYQPAPGTTVVVQPSQGSRMPYYMRQGVRVGGLALGIPCVVCMIMFGGFFLLSSTIMLATANTFDDPFFEDHNRTQRVIGGIFLTFGLLLTGGAVALCCVAKQKYRNFDGTLGGEPGRVINPGPAFATPTPGHPTTTYNAYGQVQSGVAYPAQPAPYQGQPSPYQGQPSPYQGQPSPYMGQDAPYPGQPGQVGGMAVTYQYAPPGQPIGTPLPPNPAPYAPDPSCFKGDPPGNTSNPAGYPSAPAGYPSAPTGYPSGPAGYPGAPAGYPGAPAGYPGAPAGYPGTSQPPANDYPTKGELPPPYQP